MRRMAAIQATFRRRPVMMHILAIALGAAIGANLRYGVSVWATQRFGPTFPYGTLIVNLAGCLLIGLVMELATTRWALGITWQRLLVTGLLGGLTTFSSFGYETYGLFVGGSRGIASLNVLGSVILGLLAVFLGAVLARLIP
jgi:CrcB protein